MRTGHRTEFIAAFLLLGLAVDRKSPPHLGHRGQVRIEQVEFVTGTFGGGQGGRRVLHPRELRIGRRNLDRLSDFRSGGYLYIQNVAIETQSVPAGAVIGPDILVRPAVFLDRTVEIPAVPDDAAFDPADAGFGQELLPTSEERIERRSDGILRTQGRIAPADDIKVAFQNTFLNGTGITQGGLEAVVRAQFLQRQSRRNQFGIGGGNQPFVPVVSDNRIAVCLDGHDPDGRAFQRRSRHHDVDVALHPAGCIISPAYRPLLGGSRQRQGEQENGQYFSHGLNTARTRAGISATLTTWMPAAASLSREVYFDR